STEIAKLRVRFGERILVPYLDSSRGSVHLVCPLVGFQINSKGQLCSCSLQYPSRHVLVYIDSLAMNQPHCIDPSGIYLREEIYSPSKDPLILLSPLPTDGVGDNGGQHKVVRTEPKGSSRLMPAVHNVGEPEKLCALSTSGRSEEPDRPHSPPNRARPVTHAVARRALALTSASSKDGTPKM